jgi:hypothetical protein
MKSEDCVPLGCAAPHANPDAPEMGASYSGPAYRPIARLWPGIRAGEYDIVYELWSPENLVPPAPKP